MRRRLGQFGSRRRPGNPKVIIPAGKGIELNTSDLRYGLATGLPSFDILKLYKECGGEIITIGSDSHVPETLAYDFRRGLERIKEAGINYIASFTNGKPEFHLIDDIHFRK
jgi:histidinol-phosphatase (PHP family)